MRMFLAAVFIAAAVPLAAQDRAGRDTPGEWVVTHQVPFGLWESFCDRRTTGTLVEQRCYLRYVEVFARAPVFGAQFIFVTPDGVEIGIERGTRFAEGGMRIEAGGETLWRGDRPACLRGRACMYRGAEAQTLLDAMDRGDVFHFEFTDRSGVDRSLAWDLTRFAEARADHAAALAARGLD